MFVCENMPVCEGAQVLLRANLYYLFALSFFCPFQQFIVFHLLL